MRARTWDEASFGAKFSDGPIPHAYVPAASRAREAMIEAIAELDDELMAAWVAGRELPADAGPGRATPRDARGRGVPTLVGAAFRNQGIHNLLDAVLDYLPSPADVVGGPRPRSSRIPIGRADAVPAKVGDDEPLAALAFKVQNDDAGGHANVRARLPGLPARRRRRARRDPAATSSRSAGSCGCTRTTARTSGRSRLA